MKIPRIILLAGLGLSMASADVETRRAEALGKPMETFRTLEGRIYRDVVITKISAGGVSLRHADGVARLGFEELSPGQRNYFGIDEESAAKVYRKEAERLAAYEKLVERRTEERRIRAEKEAEEREEARKVALAAAAAESERDEVVPAATIPPRPTIIRVDTRDHRSRSYGTYYGGYGYGYPVRYSYSPSFRYGGSTCRPFFGTGIHFNVR